jgi:hypothetical protein
MKQPPPFQHAPLKFTAKKYAAKKSFRRTTWLPRGRVTLSKEFVEYRTLSKPQSAYRADQRNVPKSAFSSTKTNPSFDPVD